MTNILVRPSELRRISEQLRTSAKKIDSAMRAIDNDILSLKSDKFVGNRADSLQSNYAPRREAIINTKENVLHFATDLQNVAAAFENADRKEFAALPFSGGIGGLFPFISPSWWQNIPKIIFPWDNLNLPVWLRSELHKIFSPAQVISPIAEGESPVQSESTFGKLLRQSPPTVGNPEVASSTTSLETNNTKPGEQSTSVQTLASSTGHNFEVSYNIPAQSQGPLYGNAACAPTSISMVLAYYNAKDPVNKMVSTQDIINMSDKGDGTPGKGMALSSLTDELNTLGYNNINVQINAQYSDLQTAIKNGPVIVTTGVKLVGDGIINSSGPRALEGPGNIIHAMVVTGVGNDQVQVNDPWSGTQVELSNETFQKMWVRGSSGMYLIRP